MVCGVSLNQTLEMLWANKNKHATTFVVSKQENLTDSQQNSSHFSDPVGCRVPRAVTAQGWRVLWETGKKPPLQELDTNRQQRKLIKLPLLPMH